MVKAIFFDVDGTLLSHRYERVPESTVQALWQLKEKGIKIFVATGRHALELEKLPVHGLPFDGYVTLNGQLCLDGEGRLLYGSAISADDREKMLSVFRDKEVPVLIVERERIYINFVNEAVRTAQEAISTSLPPVDAYKGDTVYQFIVFGEEEQVRAVVSRLSDSKASSWHPYAFDVIPRDGGKVTGIKQMLEHFGIKQTEIMAFGDWDNDLDMLRYAHIGVAMGNANQAAKEQADYVTADIDEDGILKALKHYGVL